MKHNYSDPILKIGVEKALKFISINEDKFNLREGNYSFIKNEPEFVKNEPKAFNFKKKL